MEAEIFRLKTLIKSNLNTNKILSTTAFEKLNVISDTIPNIINNILSLALGISKVVIDDAITFILNSALTNLQSSGVSGAGKIKGAGKFMHSYHAKRFL
jgi:hypothetical protein